MPNYQQVTFTFKDENGSSLGALKLRASYNGPYLPDVLTDSIDSKNVPKLSSPTDKFPIEYCTLNPLRGLSRIMLLEETKYDVVFETSQQKIVTSFLPKLSKEVFSRNLFNESKSSKVGILNFGSYVGRAYLSVEVDGQMSLPIDIEIRSKKIGYADEYSAMMADLSEDCSSLIYDLRSPVHQLFEIGRIERKTFYEDFLFLEFLFKEGNLPSAYHRIKESPKTQLIKEKELVPVGYVQAMELEDLIDIICMPQYLASVDIPPQNWPEAMNGYVPVEVWETSSVEALDIPENRFVKFLLEQVYDLILKLQSSYVYEGYIKDRLEYFHEEITDYLNEQWLKDVGPLTSIPMNSQALQKREGYRDIYYFYLNFEFAFQFKWEELEDSLKISEKKMSQLYEYWCFFRLINALKNVARVESNKNDLVELTKDGWEIRLKRGEKSKVKFVFFDEKGNRHYFELYYNRGFSIHGKQESRSYSLPFKPDYTIVYKAHDEEIPIYAHFDAKYRSDKELEDFNFNELVKGPQSDPEDLSNEEDEKVTKIEEEESSRKYKNADIYKMHTYKDAILNSLGAYVLYPGEKSGLFQVNDDFITPSIGALPLKPGGDHNTFISRIEKLVNGLIFRGERDVML